MSFRIATFRLTPRAPRRSITLAIVTSMFLLFTGMGAMAGEPPCVGDCNGNLQVTIGELILGVNIALQQRSIGDCPAFDGNGSGTLTIEELVRAVANALSDCGGGGELDRGLASLAAGNLIAAHGAFCAAAAADPASATAMLYCVLTRLVRNVLGDPRVMDLLNRSGFIVSGGLEEVCSLDLTSPDEVPTTAPRIGEIVDTAHAILVPEIEVALADIQRIPEQAVMEFDVRFLPECVDAPGREGVVEIDRGDVLALIAGLHMTTGLADLLTGYAVDADLHTAVESSQQVLVASEPNLLALRSTARLNSGREALRSGFTVAKQAIETILAEQDGQDNDALTIGDVDRDEAQRLQDALELFRQALDGEVTFPTSLGFREPERVNLNPLFSGVLALRGYLPGYDDQGRFDVRRFPEPTFGGMTPDLTLQDIEEMIEGGPACAVCQNDSDCESFGFLTPSCSFCLFECSGQVRRCAPDDNVVQCDDGFF